MDTEIAYSDILDKKYSVLKKNLIIIDANEERTREFEDTVRKLDAIKQEEYEKKIKEKDYLTTSLEEEYKRLYELIGLIEIRKRERDNYLDDYYNIVKQSLIGLVDIKEVQEIDNYNNRLETISDYLLNDEKYLKYQNEKDSLLVKQEEEQQLAKDEELKISELELNLLITLKDLITNSPLYDNLNFEELDDNITKYSIETSSKEKELTTYMNSYNILLSSGISEAEKSEYSSFVDSLKKEYLEILEKKYILIIYKLINDKKEQDVINIIEDRISKIKEYDLDNDNRFDNIFSMVKQYQEKIDNFEEIKMTINSIENNLDRIDDKIKEILDELNKPEITLLLKEFCIEKDYIVNNSIEEEKQELFNLPNNLDITDEIEKNDSLNSDLSNNLFSDNIDVDNVDEKILKFDAIKEVKDSDSLLDLENNRKNALEVMKRVCSSISITSEEKEMPKLDENI